MVFRRDIAGNASSKAEQPEVFENLLIVSCQESALAGYYAENIVSVHLDYLE
ncbi:MAG: hypothetical protein ACLUE8_16085 [Lachnospiraceae bacterium]